MHYLIGVDEAGYGPNLGPLVIAATAWQVPDSVAGCDLYAPLAAAVTSKPPSAGDPRLAIADSKRLFRPQSGLSPLERGVLAAAAVAGLTMQSWTEVWQAIAPDAAQAMRGIPWYADYELPLPLSVSRRDVAAAATLLEKACGDSSLRLVAIECAAVFPAQFNGFTERSGNKSDLLSHETLRLVAGLLDRCCDGDVLVLCDKHGGRNCYARLLQTRFPDTLIEVRGESAARSVYRWRSGERRVEVEFQAGGEWFLPAALASMTAKYLRELAMRPFNDFWCRRIAGLKPTAGYPIDAQRFKAAIEPLQTSLGIDDHVLWRTR